MRCIESQCDERCILILFKLANKSILKSCLFHELQCLMAQVSARYPRTVVNKPSHLKSTLFPLLLQTWNHLSRISPQPYFLDTSEIQLQVKMFSGDLAYVRSIIPHKRPNAISIPLRNMKSPPSSPVDNCSPDENKDFEGGICERLPYPKNYLTTGQKRTWLQSLGSKAIASP